MTKHTYPKTIKAAALLLDKEMPNWYTKINIDILSMNSQEYCILGQLYQDYFEAMKKLFTITSYKANDRIFGAYTKKSVWIKEINQRKSQNKQLNLPTMTVWVGKEAVKVMKAKNDFYIKEDGTVLTLGQVSLTEPKPMFKDLPFGQKFRYDNKEYIKGSTVNNVNAFCTTDYRFCCFSSFSEVTLV